MTLLAKSGMDRGIDQRGGWLALKGGVNPRHPGGSNTGDPRGNASFCGGTSCTVSGEVAAEARFGVARASTI
jgi:hypothetical protein